MSTHDIKKSETKPPKTTKCWLIFFRNSLDFRYIAISRSTVYTKLQEARVKLNKKIIFGTVCSSSLLFYNFSNATRVNISRVQKHSRSPVLVNFNSSFIQFSFSLMINFLRKYTQKRGLCEVNFAVFWIKISRRSEIKIAAILFCETNYLYHMCCSHGTKCFGAAVGKTKQTIISEECINWS